ncbi:hypothetical protein PPL_05812 [Heterostelium album PN500]|uniref:Uncharacterized protein n=1 Tax=Heterostelium pallidum (strain ATCC 26659 / Pp 5 / PN500) TaxID=670386 RepID=D3BBE6_HETP5|nr:hypothetical protein PPL_05812 [Heterostelium album PN500]EFA80979.1 hypothetical protein PPL_05812 [Heterostelium album PN500]|eukprot:XP_020433097.1 hypothetical protein PPL_05812 [Heterostelium album PN500]
MIEIMVYTIIIYNGLGQVVSHCVNVLGSACTYKDIHSNIAKYYFIHIGSVYDIRIYPYDEKNKENPIMKPIDISSTVPQGESFISVKFQKQWYQIKIIKDCCYCQTCYSLTNKNDHSFSKSFCINISETSGNHNTINSYINIKESINTVRQNLI